MRVLRCLFNVMNRILLIVLKGSALLIVLTVLWTFAYPRLFPERFKADQQAYQDWAKTNGLAK